MAISYPVPAAWAAKAHITERGYHDAYHASVNDPEMFWRDEAQPIDWITPFATVKNVSFHEADFGISGGRSSDCKVTTRPDGSYGMINLFADTARGRFAYKERGNPAGPALLFVAGLGDGLDSWDVILHGFSDYRCVTFDNRGIGGSPISAGDYTAQEMADDAHAFAEAVGLQGCLAIGSSMGGAICQEWALKYPGDMSALVLTNTWGKSDAYTRLLFESWKGLARDSQRDALVDALILFCFSPETVNANPAIAEEFRAVVSGIDMMGFQGAAAACRDHAALDRLDRLELPTLVVAATQDILVNPRHSEQLAERIAGAELRYVEGGHMVFGDNPEAWITAVKPWVDHRFTDAG